MKSLIIYAGNRGSTAAIAKQIAEAMQARDVDASAIGIDSLGVTPQRVRSADILGIGTPVYFLREPSYVTRFIDELPDLEGKKSFVYCMTGMDRVGETLERLVAGLSKRGADVVGAESFRSTMSYLPHRMRSLGNPEGLPGESELAAARRFGERLAEASELPTVQLEPPTWLTRQKARLIQNRRIRQRFFPGVRLDRSLCTGYGSCISRCKFEALVREDDEPIPIVSIDCEQCMECIDSCPRTALLSNSRLKEWISTLSFRLGIH